MLTRTAETGQMLARPVEPTQARTFSDLSPSQARALAAIVAHIREFAVPPTHHELRVILGYRSTNGVADVLGRLERKGYIARRQNKARAIRVLRQPPETT